jgi:thymidylate kinase
MAKADKKNGNKQPKARGPAKKKDDANVDAAPVRGLLVALEGTSGALIRPEAERLARYYSGEGGPAWSLWDASNTFYEMRLVKSKFLTPTPRTLLLLYASDLLFRLRWEIEPTLAEGRSVVAAPYVESAIAFGLAAGLPKAWLDELFSFAPKAEAAYRLKEKKKGKNKEKKNGNAQQPGFVEFFSASLSKHYPGYEIASVREAMTKYLKTLEGDKKIQAFGKKVKASKRTEG